MTQRADAIAGCLPGAGKAAIVLLLCLATGTVPAADRGPVLPAEDDRCPVCGMFAAKHPDFAARVTFSDGASFTFDGAKDMFRFLFDVARYAPGRSRSDVGQILVTEYYELVGIDARTALFVTGSDVHGPMGAELIPFATREDAEAFRSDHRGSAVLTFDGVGPDTLRELAATR